MNVEDSDSNSTIILTDSSNTEELTGRIIEDFKQQNLAFKSTAEEWKRKFNFEEFDEELDNFFGSMNSNLDPNRNSENISPNRLTAIYDNTSIVGKLKNKHSFSSEKSSSSLESLGEPATKKLRTKDTVSNLLFKPLGEEIIKEDHGKVNSKQKERQRKKQQSNEERVLKAAFKQIEKSIKPDECIKHITVHLDKTMENKDSGNDVTAVLRNTEYNFKFTDQLFPLTITWTRSVQTIENMVIKTNIQEEKQILLILESEELCHHVSNNNLTAHIKSLQSVYTSNDVICLAILGLQNYYKQKKNTLKREFKSQVMTLSSQTFRENKSVTQNDIDDALMELQIYCKNCYVRNVETYQDLANLVIECTKAISQIPHKLVQQQKYEQANEFFGGENKDCIRVDKNGNGLKRLWNQILTLFPLARLETAEAITSVYPTVTALFLAYESCDSNEEKEKLLQDIPIRRSAGPLANIRKIGPELSRKLYNFFCSEENIYV